ncbi:MAG: APC family permease [Gammaproteobacteria bacterium]
MAPWAAKVHRRFRMPYVTTIVTGVCVASCAAFADIAEVIDLTNIGTLFAFVLVAAGVLVLRYLHPERERPYRTPLVPFVPLAKILSCGYLMLQLLALTWRRFVVWPGAGLVLYFLYGHRRSSLRNAAAANRR